MDDAREFNVVDSAGRYLCPACGFPQCTAEPAYDADGGLIGSFICACCLWEPGFDDNPAASSRAHPDILASLRGYRSAWKGIPMWLGKSSLMPPNWDAAKQLDDLFKLAPHIR